MPSRSSSDLAVTVEDTGGGIAAKDSDHIFEPFFSTKAAGTGVGLTICRVIVEAHGGRLEVRANKPYGTIFRVILPKGIDECTATRLVPAPRVRARRLGASGVCAT